MLENDQKYSQIPQKIIKEIVNNEGKSKMVKLMAQPTQMCFSTRLLKLTRFWKC